MRTEREEGYITSERFSIARVCVCVCKKRKYIHSIKMGAERGKEEGVFFSLSLLSNDSSAFGSEWREEGVPSLDVANFPR